MLAGKPDAGNLHVRFDEGEWQDWHVYVTACHSLLYCLRVIKCVVLVSEQRTIKSRVSHGTQGHNKATKTRSLGSVQWSWPPS